VNTLYRPQLLYSRPGFTSGSGLLVCPQGSVLAADADPSAETVDLPGKALLPGFVNTHSHSFQRLIRGKSESRVMSGRDFWSWRGTMYHAAAQLDPQEVYDVARMAFLEMLLAGTTTVGEFHYLHNAPGGRPYDDPNLLSKQVIAAAQSVGIRIVLLRSAYLRSGYELPPDPGQIRFYETAPQFLENMAALADSTEVRIGVAPHSLRAVPLHDLKQIAAWSRERKLPLHMHVAEQIAENEACLREYGLPPTALLGREGLLGPDFTAVHAIHITAEEIGLLARSGTTVCSCPTTERNLGDGAIVADQVMGQGIRIALGSDSQAQIDPLEDARQLEYHLRLDRQQRAILDQIGGQNLASRLFDCATVNGARSLGLPAGELTGGALADFFTVDLDDLSIAGHSGEDLLPLAVFSLNRSAVRDVMVNGRWVVRDGRHPLQEEIVSRFKQLHHKLWGSQQ
jgi:formimidoylglutamate deiminase